jgi:hypothetical protein
MMNGSHTTKAMVGTHCTMDLRMNIENRGKRENLMGNPPLKVQCIKNEEGRKASDKKLCPSLQYDQLGSGNSAK